MAKSEERKLIEDYCRQYPNMKSLTLAKKIYDENIKQIPKLKSIEHVRRAYILGIRGLSGDRLRSLTADKSLYQERTYDTTNYKPFKEEVNTSAKVLILDIETAPLVAYTWGIWNQNIQPSNISTDWYCLTWAAKWLFEDKVYSAKLTGAESLRQDDSRIIKGIWELLNKADIVIAHNGQKFDIPKLNSRFIINKLHPPLPYQQIDTLLHIRRQFGFTSNKLDYVNQLLNLPRKKENEGMPLWIKCYKGDNKALKEMLDYNIEDVKILEETYLRIRAWIKPHPSIGLHILDETQCVCPTCGSKNLIDQGKSYYTSVNIYNLFRCDNCGSVSRKRVSEIHTKQRRHLLISTPK